MDATFSDNSTDEHGYSDRNEYITEDKWTTQVAGFKIGLSSIMDDHTDHIANGDHTIISGASKFIKTYQSMMKSHAPNSFISYALHNFRKSDSKSISFIVFSY